jgi:hypothetical protein
MNALHLILKNNALLQLLNAKNKILKKMLFNFTTAKSIFYVYKNLPFSDKCRRWLPLQKIANRKIISTT